MKLGAVPTGGHGHGRDNSAQVLTCTPYGVGPALHLPDNIEDEFFVWWLKTNIGTREPAPS